MESNLHAFVNRRDDADALEDRASARRDRRDSKADREASKEDRPELVETLLSDEAAPAD